MINIAIKFPKRISDNQPNKICSHLSENASKSRFIKPEKLQNHSNEGKGKEKKKERGEEKKAMVALLVFIMATLTIVFGRKKLLDPNGPFGGNIIKNPARYTQTQKIDHPPRSTHPTRYEQILA